MTREIKFRAWNKKGRKMIDLQKLTPLATELNGLFLPFNDDSILMQFTGLKDKNGKEIFEGDVLQNIGDRNWIEAVEWSKVRPMFSPFQRITSVDSAWKIIGNIYENPELLPT